MSGPSQFPHHPGPWESLVYFLSVYLPILGTLYELDVTTCDLL